MPSQRHNQCVFQAYYNALYNLKEDISTSQITDSGITGFLEALNLPKLSSEWLANFNAPFSIKEVSQAIAALPKGKASGPDGFLPEYYKLFTKTLAPHM